MKTLKGLTFGVLPKITYDPVLARRAALISRLEEQSRRAEGAGTRSYLCTLRAALG